MINHDHWNEAKSELIQRVEPKHGWRKGKCVTRNGGCTLNGSWYKEVLSSEAKNEEYWKKIAMRWKGQGSKELGG